MNDEILKYAFDFARIAHESINQKRKYTNDPYWYHLVDVGNLVLMLTENKDMLAAAYLHDVLEDVKPIKSCINEELLEMLFGEKVTKLVIELTDVSKLSDGNRKKRKEIDRKHLAQISKEAKLIKLADILCNVQSIKKYDSKFYKIFREEILLLLPHLKDGSEELYNNVMSELNKPKQLEFDF